MHGARQDPAVLRSDHEAGQTDPSSCFALSHPLLFPVASLKWFGFDELLRPKDSKGPNTVQLTP